MTDEPGITPENPIDSKAPWVAKQIREYLETDGKKPGFRYDAPLLLLTYRGRTSGLWKRTVLIYGEDAGRFLVVASKGGAPKHPAWYLNLQVNPQVYLQVSGQKYQAIARTAAPDEKQPLWDKMVGIFPDYADYQLKTERDIPVVILTPTIS